MDDQPLEQHHNNNNNNNNNNHHHHHNNKNIYNTELGPDFSFGENGCCWIFGMISLFRMCVPT
jgi:hypothetical protein